MSWAGPGSESGFKSNSELSEPPLAHALRSPNSVVYHHLDQVPRLPPPEPLPAPPPLPPLLPLNDIGYAVVSEVADAAAAALETGTPWRLQRVSKNAAFPHLVVPSVRGSGACIAGVVAQGPKAVAFGFSIRDNSSCHLRPWCSLRWLLANTVRETAASLWPADKARFGPVPAFVFEISLVRARTPNAGGGGEGVSWLERRRDEQDGEEDCDGEEDGDGEQDCDGEDDGDGEQDGDGDGDEIEGGLTVVGGPGHIKGTNRVALKQDGIVFSARIHAQSGRGRRQFQVKCALVEPQLNLLSLSGRTVPFVNYPRFRKDITRWFE